MSQRGRSRPGGSPAGRDSRRTRDESAARRPSRGRTTGPTASAPGSGPAAGGKPAPEFEPESSSEKPIRARGSRAGSSGEDKPERTILGLSTGKAVMLAVVVCALALTLAVPLRNYLTQRSEADRVAAQQKELEEDLKQLTRQKQQNDDPAYISAEARERLQYVKPGETPFQVQLPGEVATRPEQLSERKRTGDPWYTDLWRPIVEPQPEPSATPAPPVPGPPPPAPDSTGAGSMTIPHDQGGPVG
ncbi:cell division protein FtsB [Rhodococcus sp. PvR044]|uniref:septum formation initiator family protein n=1 Tax=Rhodococcus TaxID=1827 RepID=UPI000BE25439|nr:MULTISPECIES: septum formation initiator family protein [Rhodococcus]MBP1160215.1 cell division protein FtsB [Rhodococcus sp. PvR099]MCZ4557233.1 septum formation initiator family protein [Rhodococcus maanshanensis]